VTDYVFPDENELDIKERTREIFNVEIEDYNSQVFFAEQLPRNLLNFKSGFSKS
jgi:hypothetical protein